MVMRMNNRLRIMHVVPHLKPGGAEQMAVHLMSQLNAEKFEISALVLSKQMDSPLEQVLQARGVKIFYLGKGRGFDPRMYSRVHHVMSQVQPAITHTHVHVLRYVLPELLLGRGGIAIHTVHNLAEWEVEFRAQWLQKIAFKAGVKPISVAHEVARSLKRKYGVQKSQVIPNCIPVARYRRSCLDREEWRRQEGIGPDEVVFTCVALLRPQKNHARLLRAFAAGPGRDSKAKLLLVGSGPLERQIRQAVSEHKLEDRVRLLGMRKDVPEILAGSDVFVLSSDYEGNPLAVMEAMAAGLPIVSTSVGGVPELVTHGENGILIHASDEGGFQEAMDLLLAEPTIRKKMGIAAGRSAEEKFDLRLMIRAYEDLYASLVPQFADFAALA